MSYMMKDAKISNVEVYLVERAVKGNFADSTRNVETIGYAVTVVTLDNGLYGVGLTYHEVGGEGGVRVAAFGAQPRG